MKQTKLEVGKEYWLSPSKNEFGKLKSVSADLRGESVFTFELNCGGELSFKNMSIPEYVVEKIQEKPWQFITPIAMKCTEEQFNGIKDKLVEMEYRLASLHKNGTGYIVTNFGNKSNEFGLANSCLSFQEIKLESFNHDLFLALAAMTDKKDGIKGEWWTSETKGMCIQSYDNVSIFSLPEWLKATAQEIIEHFEKKEFVLPEKWCVKVIENLTKKKIADWRTSETEYNLGGASEGYVDNTGYWTPHVSYTEITFEQFKKYVLKETAQSCPKTPVVGSIEYTVNVKFDAEKAAKEIFSNVVKWSKNSEWEYSVISAMIGEPKNNFTSTTTIHIPPSKQATLFDDRVEITDWKPRRDDWVYSVIILEGAPTFRYFKFTPRASDTLMRGIIVKTESEAKILVEKLKAAML